MFKQKIQSVLNKILVKALQASNRERKENLLKQSLINLVPDISNQYSNFTVSPNDEYLTEKVRTLHAFQISTLLSVVDLFSKEFPSNSPVNVVDIGDSAGTHLRYLAGIRDGLLLKTPINSLSVNIDQEAVNRIRAKGLQAICCRAEELEQQPEGLTADIFMMFETLEHLINPIGFLETLSRKSNCSFFVVTIPYVYQSRIGLHQLRQGSSMVSNPENTHIFELAPADWKLLFKFSGWDVVFEDIYTQYPRFGFLRLTQPIWARLDFPGFYAVVLRRNPLNLQCYAGW